MRKLKVFSDLRLGIQYFKLQLFVELEDTSLLDGILQVTIIISPRKIQRDFNRTIKIKKKQQTNTEKYIKFDCFFINEIEYFHWIPCTAVLLSVLMHRKQRHRCMGLHQSKK